MSMSVMFLTLFKNVFVWIIIIIISIRSPLCKAGREWEHYQSKDPNPTQPTHGRKKKIKQ